MAVDIDPTDRQTVDDFEAAKVAFDEVVAVRRLFGQPDYLVQVAVADAMEFEGSPSCAASASSASATVTCSGSTRSAPGSMGTTG